MDRVWKAWRGTVVTVVAVIAIGSLASASPSLRAPRGPHESTGPTGVTGLSGPTGPTGSELEPVEEEEEAADPVETSSDGADFSACEGLTGLDNAICRHEALLVVHPDNRGLRYSRGHLQENKAKHEGSAGEHDPGDDRAAPPAGRALQRRQERDADEGRSHEVHDEQGPDRRDGRVGAVVLIEVDCTHRQDGQGTQTPGDEPAPARLFLGLGSVECDGACAGLCVHT